MTEVDALRRELAELMGDRYHPGKLNSEKGRVLKARVELLDLGQLSTLTEKLLFLRTELTELPTCSCGTSLRFSANGKLQRFCSPRCAAASSSTKERRQATNLQRYGAAHAAAAKTVRQKIEATNLVKYGTAASWAGAEVRQRAASTNLLRYGAENAARSPAVAQRIAVTLKQRSPEASALTTEKRKQTTLQRYGVEHHAQRPDFKNGLRASRLAGKFGDHLDEQLKRIEADNQVVALFTKDEWRGSEGRHLWQHLPCGRQFEAAGRLSRDHRCPFCRTKSKVQQKVEDLVASLGIDYLVEDRSIIAPYELDLVVPSKRVAIEVNGTFWHHSEAAQLPLLRKTELAEAQGYQLLHLWDFEVDESWEKVESIIRSKLGFTVKVPARRLEVRRLSPKEARAFFERCHIQGAAPCSVALGLLDGDKVLAAASFGARRFGKFDQHELIRYASELNCTVVGGLSRLIAAYRRLGFEGELFSFADRRFSTGNAYRATGWKEVGTSAPGYFYEKGVRVSRFGAMKHRLPALLGDQFDPALSEAANMLAAGWRKCVDCGNLKFALSP